MLQALWVRCSTGSLFLQAEKPSWCLIPLFPLKPISSLVWPSKGLDNNWFPYQEQPLTYNWILLSHIRPSDSPLQAKQMLQLLQSLKWHFVYFISSLALLRTFCKIHEFQASLLEKQRAWNPSIMTYTVKSVFITLFSFPLSVASVPLISHLLSFPIFLMLWSLPFWRSVPKLRVRAAKLGILPSIEAVLKARSNPRSMSEVDYSHVLNNILSSDWDLALNAILHCI